jgi:Bardet-Biedl syndrome 4 protein
MGKFNQSLEIFLKAESCLEAPDYEVYHFIAELLRQNTRHSKANSLDVKEYFRRSIMCGKQVKTYKTLASIFRKERDYIKAIELLESSLKLVPEPFFFLWHYYPSWDVISSLSSRSVAPGNVEILADLGIMYLKINEVDRAYEKLQDAIRIDGRHTNSLLAVGAIQQTRHDIDSALNAYKNIRGIQDEGFEIWSNIGLCFYRKNKLIAVGE